MRTALVVALTLAAGCGDGEEGRSGATFAASIGGGDAAEGGSEASETTAASSGGEDTGAATWGAATGWHGATTTGTGDTAGAPPQTYPPCEVEVCAEGSSCLTFEDGSVCGQTCAAASDCPAPASGDAPAACRSIKELTVCTLDCGAGQACPDQMTCDLVLGEGALCVWP